MRLSTRCAWLSSESAHRREVAQIGIGANTAGQQPAKTGANAGQASSESWRGRNVTARCSMSAIGCREVSNRFFNNGSKRCFADVRRMMASGLSAVFASTRSCREDLAAALASPAVRLSGCPAVRLSSNLENRQFSAGFAFCRHAQEGVHVVLRLARVEGFSKLRHAVFDRCVERHGLPPTQQALLLA